MERQMRICELRHLSRLDRISDWTRYVINSEAAKALYKTMPGKASKEPKDLGREWHSDGAYIAFNREACQLTSPAFSDV